jgi:hypothetical protein
VEKLLENYLLWLSGKYNRDDIKSEIQSFKQDEGNTQEFEVLIINATKGLYKKNLAVGDFWKFYNDYTPIVKSKKAYGTGHMEEFR